LSKNELYLDQRDLQVTSCIDFFEWRICRILDQLLDLLETLLDLLEALLDLLEALLDLLEALLDLLETLLEATKKGLQLLLCNRDNAFQAPSS
jgi:hypothetical protein